MSLSASLRERGRNSGPVRLLDLSAFGCRIEAWFDLEPDAQVWLKLPGLEPRFARIAWSRGGFAGLEFESPLHEAVLDALAGLGAEPTPAELAELKRISARCRALAAADSDPTGDALLDLAGYCDGEGGGR